jgi:hypothetical protein
MMRYITTLSDGFFEMTQNKYEIEWIYLMYTIP